MRERMCVFYHSTWADNAPAPEKNHFFFLRQNLVMYDCPRTFYVEQASLELALLLLLPPRCCDYRLVTAHPSPFMFCS